MDDVWLSIIWRHHAALFPLLTIRDIHLRETYAFGVGNGFPSFDGRDETNHVDERPAHQPKPKGKKGFCIDLWELVLFKHDDKAAEKHTPDHRVNEQYRWNDHMQRNQMGLK